MGDFVFKRNLDAQLIQHLAGLAMTKGNWWADVLASRNLPVCIRNGYLNVYWKGQSLFRVGLEGAAPAIETHYKYLLRPVRKPAYVRLRSTAFLNPPNDAIRDSYDGPGTLREMIKAAEPFSIAEKGGVHAIAVHRRNTHVVDLEIGFSRDADALDETEAENVPSREQRRMDIAILQRRANGVHVVFYEAKHFSNTDLRARGDGVNPPVLAQLHGYEALISKHKSEIEVAYGEACGVLSQVLEAEGLGVRQAHHLIGCAANAGRVQVDTRPHLIVFGFDEDQKRGPVWAQHLAKLERQLGKANVRGSRLRAVGNPAECVLADTA